MFNLFLFIIFSEGEYETFYYSYPSHLDELIKSLKDDGHERPLVQTLEEKYDIITQHMKCTEELTNAAKGNPLCKRFGSFTLDFGARPRKDVGGKECRKHREFRDFCGPQKDDESHSDSGNK